MRTCWQLLAHQNKILCLNRRLCLLSMDRFAETLNPKLKTEGSVMIIQTMVNDTLTSKTKIDKGKLDWDRVQWADPRDPRATSNPCNGHHVIQKFGKGSRSGVNGHALWLSCSQCQLRLAYVPKVGAPATFRSPGPVAADVKSTLEKIPPNEMDPRKLTTTAIGLEAAEQSTLKRLEKIQQKKKELFKKSENKQETNMDGVLTPDTMAKKSARGTDSDVAPKRTNEQTAEEQEIKTEGWIPVNK